MKRIALTLSARSTAVLIVGAVVLAAVVLIAVARPSTTSADCAAGGFCLDLTPSSAARPVGASHTVSAALTTSSGSGVGGFTVTFSIATGPNAGGSGSCTPSDCKTDPAGNVSFTYTSNGTEGTDTIQACATDGVIKIAQQAACGPGQVGATATVAWLETTLTVTKVITNDNGGAKQIADFTLRVDEAVVTSGAATTLEAGSHTVSEDPTVGYASTIGGDCAADGTVTLALGDDKSCTITNDDIAPTLTVTKTVTNDNGGTKQVTDFTLRVDGSVVTSGAANTLDAGPHSVSEDPAAGYATIIGGDCAADGTITLALGDAKACTITNDDIAPTLSVTKVVTNDNGGTKQVADFTLRVDSAAVTSGAATTIDAGPHTVSEDPAEGYASTIGGDCAAEGAITLAPGDEKACTVTNNDVPAMLTVNKVVINTKSEQLFLGDKELAVKTAADFKLRVDDSEVRSGVATTVNAGVYTVGEDDPSADFYNATISGDCSAGGSITLQLGDVKNCTVTNTFDEQKARAAGARGRRALPATGGQPGAADDDLWIFVVVASAGTVIAMTGGYVLLKRRGFL